MQAFAVAQTNFSRLLRYIRPERRLYRRASVYSVVNKLFDIAPELLIGMAVDVVVQQEASVLARLGMGEPAMQLVLLGGLTVLTWGGESWFQYLYQLRWRTLAQLVQARVRSDVYDHVQSLPTEEWTRRRSGELQTLLTEDVNQLERFLNSGINDVIQVVTSTVAVMTVFFVLAPEVAMLAVLPIPVVAGTAVLFQRGLAERYRDVRAQGGRLGARLTAQLSGLTTIRAFGAESRALAALREDSSRYVDANRRAIGWSSAFVPLVRMAILVGFVVTLVLGGLRTLDGSLGVGAFSVLVFLTQRLLWPFTRLGETVDLYQRSMASAGRLFDLLELPRESSKGDLVVGPKPALTLDGVRFRYPGAHRDALSGLDLVVAPNTFVGIVGTTGSGKSTLVKLLLKFYQPSEGSIMVGARSLSELAPKAVRDAIGWVAQDVFIFFGTVRENIALGRPEALEAEIEAAARAAEIHDFITRLPDGYDTVLGEFGSTLSGGERQRLAIARALVKDPPILIFDEATSAVDNETEAAIQRSIHRAARGRTVVAIAHRLSTVRDADKIVVLSEGTVVEEGGHAELVAKGGHYAKLLAAVAPPYARSNPAEVV